MNGTHARIAACDDEIVLHVATGAKKHAAVDPELMIACEAMRRDEWHWRTQCEGRMNKRRLRAARGAASARQYVGIRRA